MVGFYGISTSVGYLKPKALGSRLTATESLTIVIVIHNRLKFTSQMLVSSRLRGRVLNWRLNQLVFDPCYGNLVCLATLMSSDWTKQICLWMTVYIHIKYIWLGLVKFYSISTIVGYLMPNPLYMYIFRYMINIIYIYIYIWLIFLN